VETIVDAGFSEAMALPISEQSNVINKSFYDEANKFFLLVQNLSLILMKFFTMIKKLLKEFIKEYTRVNQ